MPFSQEVRAILDLEDEAVPVRKLSLLKALCFEIGDPIQLPTGIDIPSPEASESLLEDMRICIPAIDRLARKITLSDVGCWELPLLAEYDTKGRARYPQVTDREAGAKNLLAHRYVARVALGATLGRLNFIDHICRVHACCNVTHFDFVTPGQNNQRSIIHRETVIGQERLF